MRWLLTPLVALALTVSVTAAASSEEVYTVRGVVTAPLREGLVTVKHEAVAGYMPAMTMPFQVDPGALGVAAALRPGDRIEFKFAVGTSSRAFDFTVLASDHALPPPGTAPTPAPRLREGQAVPDFALVDQEGRPVTQADLRDRFTVITFIFTRCPVPEFCPRMSTQFQTLQRRIAARPPRARPVQLLSISFDPAYDTPAILRSYAERYGADPKIWRFCTGSEAETGSLVRAFAVHLERNGATIEHTLATALVGPDTTVRAIWRGNAWQPDEVWQALQKESEP